MPFGLTNAPCTFQILMQSVLRGLERFSLPYIDDVVIFSQSFDEHISHVSSVLSRLAQAGLTVKKEKCSWCFTSFDFLGFHVGLGTLSIPQSKIIHISNYIMPKTKSSLKSFLELITFYSKFIPNLANLTSVLTPHLTKHKPEHLLCDDDFVTAFELIIGSISSHTSLIIPNSNDVLSVFSDASYAGIIGGTLCVRRDDDWIPASFYSRQLSPAERNYAILGLEATALLATIEHFRLYLAGRFFKVFTDHKPLINIIDGPAPSARLTRWKLRLLEFNFEIQHIRGVANPIADALSPGSPGHRMIHLIPQREHFAL